MRYGIISDVHGNIEALDAVIKECKRQRIDSLLCAGDIVGYGASPKECLHVIRQHKAVAVAGNHDWAVCGKLDFSHFTDDGQAAVIWTRSHIAFEDVPFLSALPLCLANAECMIVHAGLHEPQNFVYMTNVSKTTSTFERMTVPVCFIGHTHVPKIYVMSQGQAIEVDDMDISVDHSSNYIVNVGSVGQPRDKDPRASFCVYDTSYKRITLHRVDYDIEAAQEKIRLANLPESLALRLKRGQ